MAIHSQPHEMAGQTVKIKDECYHPQEEEFGGAEFRIEDWWDRVSGTSWTEADGNPAAMVYGLRAGMNNLPLNDEVVYGKIGPYGHLVHVSELEYEENKEN